MAHYNGTIRPATPTDLASIVDIYNQAVHDRIATCDLSDVAVDERRAWFDRHVYPYGIWVAEEADGVDGWVVISPYDPKSCFHRTATFATYVRREARGHGVGTVLRRHMIDTATCRGFHAMVNRVWANNHASIALAKRFGFQQVGHMPELVDLDGEYIDCLFFELILEQPKGGQS